jgi:hypothetical protein
MAIVSSVFKLGHAQKDGRRYVIERHTDDAGGVHQFEYLAADGDHNAVMLSRVPQLEEQLADREFRQTINADSAFTLNHQTAAQFAARLREVYRTLEKEEVCRVAWWLIRRILAGHVTDNQVRNAFGMTVQQYNNFKTRLQAAHDHWQAVIDARGE